MNPTSKKFISLFLIFSLLILSVNLYAKERRGAELIIQRIGDQVRQVKKTRLEGTPWETSVITGIWGELIAVKQDSLLLLDAGGKDVSVNIAEIKVVRIVKKSEFWKGAMYGALTGGGAGALIGYSRGDDEPEVFASATAEEKALMFGALGLIIGGLIGILLSANSKDKTIQIEGMTDLEIQKTMDKLRKKARIRDYK